MPGSDGETRNRVGRLERLLSARGTANAGTDLELLEVARELTAENARLSRTLRTALEIGTAVGSDTDLPRILELIVERARTLVDADDLLIWLRHGDQLRIAAVAGHADVPRDAAIPLGTSTAGMALQAQRSLRVEDAQQMLISPSEFGMSQASSSLLVPLVHRGHGLGVLVAFDRLGATASFDADNERALEAFAASAATAVATARLVEEHRLHDSIAAAESERGRWARELHDETLQALGGLKVLLSGAARLDDAEAMRQTMRVALDQLGGDIHSLRSMIAELRPPALDELGLAPALTSLAQRTSTTTGLDVRSTIDIPAEPRLAAEVETTVYRIVQESLTNVAKHANAATVELSVQCAEHDLLVSVSDDGVGFDTAGGQDGGFGLTGMQERVDLAGGELTVAPGSSGGTVVRARLPLG